MEKTVQVKFRDYACLYKFIEYRVKFHPSQWRASDINRFNHEHVYNLAIGETGGTIRYDGNWVTSVRRDEIDSLFVFLDEPFDIGQDSALEWALEEE